MITITVPPDRYEDAIRDIVEAQSFCRAYCVALEDTEDRWGYHGSPLVEMVTAHQEPRDPGESLPVVDLFRREDSAAVRRAVRRAASAAQRVLTHPITEEAAR